MKAIRRFFGMLLAFLAVAFGLSLTASPALAAITWDFSVVTGELGGLATALITAIGAVVTACLIVWGVIKSFKPLMRLAARLLG